jgi:hypothetical protein
MAVLDSPSTRVPTVISTPTRHHSPCTQINCQDWSYIALPVTIPGLVAPQVDLLTWRNTTPEAADEYSDCCVQNPNRRPFLVSYVRSLAWFPSGTHTPLLTRLRRPHR